MCHLEAVLGYRQAYISQHIMVLREAVATIFAGSVTALTGSSGRIPLREILLVVVFAVLAVVNIRGVKQGARVLEGAGDGGHDAIGIQGTIAPGGIGAVVDRVHLAVAGDYDVVGVAEAGGVHLHRAARATAWMDAVLSSPSPSKALMV